MEETKLIKHEKHYKDLRTYLSLVYYGLLQFQREKKYNLHRLKNELRHFLPGIGSSVGLKMTKLNGKWVEERRNSGNNVGKSVEVSTRREYFEEREKAGLLEQRSISEWLYYFSHRFLKNASLLHSFSLTSALRCLLPHFVSPLDYKWIQSGMKIF